MLTVIGSSLLSLLVVAGLMAIVGLHRQAATVFCWTIAAGIAVSFLATLTQGLDWSFRPSFLSNSGVGIDVHDVELVVVGVALVVGVILVATAYVRFTSRYRRVKTWFAAGQKPTSLKRRVDRE